MIRKLVLWMRRANKDTRQQQEGLVFGRCTPGLYLALDTGYSRIIWSVSLCRNYDQTSLGHKWNWEPLKSLSETWGLRDSILFLSDFIRFRGCILSDYAGFKAVECWVHFDMSHTLSPRCYVQRESMSLCNKWQASKLWQNGKLVNYDKRGKAPSASYHFTQGPQVPSQVA